MKILIEIILAVIFHPVAVVLTWINILGRSDLNSSEKVIWMVVTLIWGVGPLLYIAVGGGSMW
ncbi:MAG: PLDc N-terminal domain-containing protein [Chloroflexota bacterium]|nr:PLDc N-terminal domain-containing protein [Chloroflexota bacterium]